MSTKGGTNICQPKVEYMSTKGGPTNICQPKVEH